MLSPHLDDAVLSLGAALHSAAARGADVTVLTVFAGNPASTAPAGDWDRRSGFENAGEAAEARREEDRQACALIGAEPLWLDFDLDGSRSELEAAIWARIATALDGADVVLAPGFPLEHRDHALIARLVDEHGLPAGRLGIYLEQPYTLWTQAPSGSREALQPSWRRLTAGPRDRLAKLRAARAYRSQLPLLGPRVLATITRYEAARGGEGVIWPVAGSTYSERSHEPL